MIDIHEVIATAKIETYNERLIFRALGMIRERALFWEAEQDYKRAGAYGSAANILAYAMMKDIAALNNFDYYNEDVTEEWACTPAAVAKECEVTQ
jgi:hypothetical protein